MEIEINGIKYQEKEQNKSTKRLPYSVLAALAFASFDPFLPKQKSFNPPNVNIITEYELILNKKSKLSSRKREWVVKEFKRNFVQIN